jgi:hypothetical protein
LDLSQSLVSDWEEVELLALPLHLAVLDLSSNLLPPPLQPSPRQLPALRHLVLGKMLHTGYSWQEVLLLTSAMPGLAILQLHGNNLSSLGPVPEGALHALQELDLDDNQLSSWGEIEHLAALPQLTALRLNCNQLSVLAPAPGSFPALRSLQLSGNQISTYTAVGALDALALTELRLRSNPLNWAEKDEETVRQLVVARIRTLAHLNGSVVTDTERKWAEIDYLKTPGAEYLSLAENRDSELRASAPASFLAAHNRYQDIVERYGQPQQGEGVAVDTR